VARGDWKQGMNHSLDPEGPDQLIDELMRRYLSDIRRYAERFTRGDTQEAESLALRAFEQTYYDLCNNPKVIERPKWWLQKAVENCFRNSQRSKLRQVTTSLELHQENQGATKEPLAPEEDEPEHVLEKRERETEQQDAKKKRF
jgi:hypothetical protein